MRPPAASAASQAGLGVFAGHGDVDVHRVPQRLGLVELLHPDRRSVTEAVNGVVLSCAGVPEDRAPESEVDLGRAGGDGELHLLRAGTVRDRAVLPRDSRDASSQVGMVGLELPNVACQPHRDLVVSPG